MSTDTPEGQGLYASTDTPLRQSPLHGRHEAAAARMAEFAGWTMPIDYGSTIAEHKAVRERAGIFDVSHLGTVAVSGPRAAEVVQRSFSNDVDQLDVGKAHYTLCLDEEAGIIDDLLVYRLPDWILVVPNAANTAAITARLLDASKDIGADTGEGAVTITVIHHGCIAVQGPDSPELLAQAMTAIAEDLGTEYPSPTEMSYLDCADLGEAQVLSRSGYTGETGFEVFLTGERTNMLWDALVGLDVPPVGLACRDTLRLEMGYPLHGNDISTDTTPVEARLGWAVKVGSGFVGEESYAAAKEAGPSRRLWGLKADGRRAPRPGDEVLVDDQVVGTVTSGSFSPMLEVGIGMAYLAEGVEAGPAEVDSRGKRLPVEVQRPPFWTARTK